MTGWFGYCVSGGGPYTAVAAAWTVPALNVGSSTVPSNVLMWVGLDGSGTAEVEQCGIAGFIDPDSTVRYQGWAEFYPANEEWFSPAAYPVSAGDSVTASAVYTSYQGRGAITLSVADITQGWTASVTKTSAALAVENGFIPQRYSAECVIEADQPENVMADFGSFTFTNVTGLGTSPPSITGTDGSNQARISSAWNNGSFTLAWNETGP
jgi:Peptidase A4 family